MHGPMYIKLIENSSSPGNLWPWSAPSFCPPHKSDLPRRSNPGRPSEASPHSRSYQWFLLVGWSNPSWPEKESWSAELTAVLELERNGRKGVPVIQYILSLPVGTATLHCEPPCWHRHTTLWTSLLTQPHYIINLPVDTATLHHEPPCWHIHTT